MTSQDPLSGEFTLLGPLRNVFILSSHGSGSLGGCGWGDCEKCSVALFFRRSRKATKNRYVFCDAISSFKSLAVVIKPLLVTSKLMPNAYLRRFNLTKCKLLIRRCLSPFLLECHYEPSYLRYILSISDKHTCLFCREIASYSAFRAADRIAKSCLYLN
jgi:hypothetical protein